MFSSQQGELAALFTAICWTVTAIAFESATKKVGSLVVNILRLVFALIFLSILSFILRGKAFPVDASIHGWTWLSVSGLIGFVAGDYFLFKSYPIISSRIAMVIMTLVPPITALIGWLLMGEILSLLHFSGMTLVISGITMAVLSRNKKKNGYKFSYPAKGILFAFLGTVGQAVGLVLSKYGMQDYNAFASTQIRIIAGLIGFIFIITYYRRWGNVIATMKNKKAMRGITIGSFFGPFLGVSFSLISIQLVATGIASTIMAIVPVLIIAPSVIIFKQKITLPEIIGAVISVIGVAVLFYL